MVVKVSTAEMAKLYEDGLSLEAIGQKFGMTKQGVRDRFIKAGIERHKTKYKQINREHLETLYLEQRMSIDRIC